MFNFGGPVLLVFIFLLQPCEEGLKSQQWYYTGDGLGSSGYLVNQVDNFNQAKLIFRDCSYIYIYFYVLLCKLKWYRGYLGGEPHHLGGGGPLPERDLV